MDFQFNLLDEPWIPCVSDTLALPTVLSLRDVLAQATSLRRIVDPRPTTLIALHRMIVALLHRALQGPSTPQEWRTMWQQRAWGDALLQRYLDGHHDRFDLFDACHPFFQTPGLDLARAVAVSTLAQDRASNVNSPMIFDHQLLGASISPAEAARWLLGHQYFATPGLISDDGPMGKVSASGSPLMGSLVCLAQGRSLFETLLLNMVPYDRAHDFPFPFTDDDQPVWERESPVGRTVREPAGYVDWLTWPSRRILLAPERDAEGNTVVRRVVLMDGTRTPAGSEPWRKETMVAYRKNPKADTDHTQPPFLAVRLNPERAIWRESHTLLSGFTTTATAKEKIGPAVLAVLAEMAPNDMRDYLVVPLLVAGVINDQKLVENWGQDSLAVSPHLLQSRTLVNALQQALNLAETLGRLLAVRIIELGAKGKRRPSPMMVLAMEYIRGMSERVPQPKDYGAIADHLGSRRDYWAALALPFHSFLRGLPEAIIADDDQGEIVGVAVQRQWLDDASQACRRAFADALTSLGESPRAWRARAIAEVSFATCCALATQAYKAAWGGVEA